MKRLASSVAPMLACLCMAAQCQDMTRPTKSQSSSSTRYYVSANGCQTVSGVSYSGYDYSTCNHYYRQAVSYRCTKILDNCR